MVEFEAFSFSTEVFSNFPSKILHQDQRQGCATISVAKSLTCGTL